MASTGVKGWDTTEGTGIFSPEKLPKSWFVAPTVGCFSLFEKSAFKVLNCKVSVIFTKMFNKQTNVTETNLYISSGLCQDSISFIPCLFAPECAVSDVLSSSHFFLKTPFCEYLGIVFIHWNFHEPKLIELARCKRQMLSYNISGFNWL